MLLVSGMMRAQPVGFTQYMAADGLSDNNVLCGLRDQYGFMWLGTNNGLNCFDGTQNIVYRNMVEDNASFENNTITSIFEHEQDIWFGGSFGLYVYHRSTNSFSRFDKKTRYGVNISTTVQNIVGGQDGKIWIGTLGQGMFIYDPQTDQLTQDSRHGAFISDVKTHDDSPVFMASMQGDIYTFGSDGREQKHFTIPGYVSDKNKICLEAIDYKLYIGCERGLFRVHRGEQEVEPVAGVNTGIHAIQAKGSDLLLGTEDGLFLYSPATQQLTRYDNHENLNVNALYWDRDSTLWVMTEMGGVIYMPMARQDVGITSMPEGVQEVMVRAVCEAPDGLLWVGTDRGLCLYDCVTQRITPFEGPNLKQEINTLMIDGNDLWIGTRHNGIIVMDTSTGTQRHYQYSNDRSYTIPSNEITSLLRTTEGNIYVGTSWGLCRYERTTENFMWYFEIGSQTHVTCLTEDKTGRVWAATSNHGLFCQWEPGSSFRNFTYRHQQPLSLPGNDVSTVFCDHRGDVWIATTDGTLSRYLPEKEGFERYDSRLRYLQDQQIYFIVEDLNHNLWIGFETGMLKIGADRNPVNVQMLQPRKNVSREPKPHNSAYVTRQGELFAGRYNELAHFYPDRISFTHDKMPVYIMSLTFPYRANDIDNLNDNPDLNLNFHWPFGEGSVTLPYADNSFTLHFAAPQFMGGDAIQRFEYMLQGVDKNWARGTNNAEATYANVSPGTYEFLLRKAGDTDTDNYAHLSITVLPPWYRTTLAYIIYALLIVAFIIYLQRYYSNRLRRRYTRRMKAYQAQQEKANFESKIHFFINLVHEIRTPLTLMSLPLEAIENNNVESANKNHISAIRRNMNYLLGITNQLLDFQKAEHGHIQLNLTNCDVGQLLDNIYSQFSDAMEVQGKRIQLQLPESPITTALDVDKVQKVMMNLVGNAVKYARTEIIIRLEQIPATNDQTTNASNDELRISVIDDGPGVPPEERDKIFDLYHQIGNDNVAATLGTGLGLNYAKMLAQAHEGDLVLSDSVGGGSNFQLILPIRETLPLPEMEGSIYAQDGNGAEELSTSLPHREGSGESPFSHRILLVEDNEELLQMTTDVLRQYYRVLKARDGQEALDVLQYNDVDVIVSDVMMPRMDGIELCKRIKEDINYSHIPVILLTAKTSVEAKLEGMQSGADVYLEKPFSSQQLHLQIMSLLRMRKTFHERMKQIDGTAAITANEGELGLNQQDLLFMERLQQMVNDNMRDEEFSIDLLAEQMNMSRSSFYRKIKALTDMTPIEYLKMRRLDQAALLLRQGVRITEVAERVGFTSSSYFAKCFKAKFDCLPKDYVASLNAESDA